MGITVADLQAVLSADTSEAEKGITGVIEMLGGGGPLVGAVAVAGAAMLAVGVVSTKMAGDFQQGMTSLVTGAGEAQSNIGLVSAGILNLSVDTATGTKQLTDGMYMIESAGFHGAAGLQVLKDAAQGAKVGSADLGVVADATTTILKDFADTGITSSQAVNTLITTVASGKTHMEDLAGAMSQILPTASAAKVGLYDVMGAMATMTGEGVPAANAATYLRQTIIGLAAPSAGTVKALADVGLKSKDVAAAMQESLPDALKMITDAVGKKFPEGSAAYVNALKDISGGSKTMQGVLDLTGQHMKDFVANTISISGTAVNAGSSIQGWGDVQQDFNFKIEKARAVVEKLGIEFGTKLLPVLGHVADFVSANLTPTVMNIVVALTHLHDGAQAVWNFFANNQAALDAVEAILVTVALAAVNSGIAVLTVLVPAFIAWAVAAGAAAVETIAATWPILAVVAGIALLAFGIIELVQHWGAVQAFFGNLGSIISKFFVDVAAHVIAWVAGVGQWFAGIGAAILGTLVGQFNSIKTFIQNAITGWLLIFNWLYEHNYAFKFLVDLVVFTFNNIKTTIFEAWNAVTGFLSGIWNWLTSTVSFAFNFIKTTIERDITFAKAVIMLTWNAVTSFLSGVWDNITSGVTRAWDIVVATVRNALAPVKTAATNTAMGILQPILDIGGKMFDAGKHIIQMLIDGVKNMAGAVGNAVHNVIGGALGGLGFHGLPGFASGTDSAPGGLAIVGENGPEVVALPAGARVFPHGSVSTAGAGGAGGVGGSSATQPIYLMVDDGGLRVFARAVLPHQVNEIRRATGSKGA